MGILRSDVVSHSQLEPTGGSIYLDGTGDYLSIASADAFAFGTGAFTFECWVNRPSLSAATQICGSSNDNFNLYMNTNGTISLWNGSANITTTNTIDDDTWTHVAICRVGSGNGQMRVFIDGVQGVNGTNATDYAAGNLLIGRNSNSGSTYGKGYISNVRVTRTAVYKQNFTVPKFELENITGTILLCCRSSSSATASDVTYAAITSNGDTTASALAPDLKSDITDTGVVFEDNTKFDTLSYMVPPAGTTAQRGRGRGLIMGGGAPAPTSIEYIQIQSAGTGIDFGDLTGTMKWNSGGASSTRGLSIGGNDPVIDTIEYVTIATTSNAIDFGNLTVARRYPAVSGNETRCVNLAGYNNNSPILYTNIIDYITIASAGNATDFGDTAEKKTNGGGVNSSTRGIIGGGQGDSPYPKLNTIEYITIATTANATDFGDLTVVRRGLVTSSSSTRGIFGGGVSPSAVNTIDYVTIATTGNATDFGDMTAVISYGGSGVLSSHIRGVLCHSGYPSASNILDYVTIATTGNAQDFGDLRFTRLETCAVCSDSHGGIS